MSLKSFRHHWETIAHEDAKKKSTKKLWTALRSMQAHNLFVYIDVVCMKLTDEQRKKIERQSGKENIQRKLVGQITFVVCPTTKYANTFFFNGSNVAAPPVAYAVIVVFVAYFLFHRMHSANTKMTIIKLQFF